MLRCSCGRRGSGAHIRKRCLPSSMSTRVYAETSKRGGKEEGRRTEEEKMCERCRGEDRALRVEVRQAEGNSVLLADSVVVCVCVYSY